MIEIGGYICDTNAREVQNSEDSPLQRPGERPFEALRHLPRSLNCALPSDIEPGFVNLELRALPAPRYKV